MYENVLHECVHVCMPLHMEDREGNLMVSITLCFIPLSQGLPEYEIPASTSDSSPPTPVPSARVTDECRSTSTQSVTWVLGTEVRPCGCAAT